MSKRSGGTNRICLHCRLKYPGKFTNNAKDFNITSVCSVCTRPLTLIHDSVRIPKRKQVKLWEKLAKDIANGTVETPVCKVWRARQLYKEHPEHEAIDDRIRARELRQKRREQSQSLEDAFPGITKDFVERQARYQDFDWSTDALWADLIACRDDLSKADIYTQGIHAQRMHDWIYSFMSHNLLKFAS